MPMPYLNLSQVELIAREAHREQTDKAGRPYAEHLAAVAGELVTVTLDPALPSTHLSGPQNQELPQ